jgi:L-threonylcarbamoyladenylate synthase
VDDGKTLLLTVDARALESDESRAGLDRAATILREGGTVAFPTETVYGLGANALDASAVGRIFEAKRRPSWDPLIVHGATLEQLANVVAEIPASARLLIDKFWPGPLTLLLPKHSVLPEIVTAGRNRVGVRMPQHPVARRLIELAGLPIAAPSANSFGRTSPTRAKFVLEDLEGRIDAVIDSGETTLGLESTVLDVCENPPVLYRPGMVTVEQLQAVCGTVVRYREAQNETPASGGQASPGIGLKHYAPRAKLVLLDTAAPEVADIFARVTKWQAEGEIVGLLLPDGYKAIALPPIALVYSWGKWNEREELARRLFAGLRELDAKGLRSLALDSFAFNLSRS